MFNNHYINIVEKISGNAPENLADSSLPENDEETVNKILKHYEKHPSVSKIKYNQNEILNFDFPTANVEDINKIKSLNPELTMESSIKLLGTEIDNKLNFEKHISNICQKASNQLNSIW